MPSDAEKHEEIGHRKTRADNHYFMGLFEWGSTPRETEIAAEEYMYFRGEQDLTEAHDHKDDRWRLYKQKTLSEAGKKGEGTFGHLDDETKDPVVPMEGYVERE